MKRYFFFCLLLGCGLPVSGQLPDLGSFNLSEMAQLLGDARQLVFEGRAILPASLKILEDPALRPPGLTEEEYVRFVEKALVVRNTGVVDNPAFQYDPFSGGQQKARGPWTFPNLLRTAWHGLDPAKIDTEAQKLAFYSPLLGGFWSAADQEKQLNNIPLRLLAVVNRLDLARLVANPGGAPGAVQCPKGKLCGAEIHFVYAGMIPPNPPQGAEPYCTVILEFVFPPLSKEEFQGMAAKWMKLYAQPGRSDSPADVGVLLDGLLQRWSNGPGTARIRMNRFDSHWNVFQFALTTQGLIFSPLNQEPNLVDLNLCVTADSPVGKYTAKYGASIRRSDYDFFQPPGSCPGAAGGPQSCAGTFLLQAQALTLQSGLVQPPAKTDATRFSLSLNSCTGCHGRETHGASVSATGPFDQIRYREPQQMSTLSNFLTGGEDGDPHLYQTWTVQPPVVAGCGTPAVAKSYNDLLRRAVFLLVVTSLPAHLPRMLPSHAEAELDRLWSIALNRHGITAWQPH